MTLSAADQQDKAFWKLAKEMYNEQTAGLPVHTWEQSTPETRLMWRKAAQFVVEKGPRQEEPATQVDHVIVHTTRKEARHG
jgi:hypothetical protein